MTLRTPGRFFVSLRAALVVSLTANQAQPAPPAGDVSWERALTANADDWLLNGGTFRAEHFSPLDQINVDNVQQLGLAWSLDLDTPDGLAATPIVVDGVIYLSGPFAVVYAIDARSGRLLWRHDPQPNLGLTTGSSWAARLNRGVAVWRGKVFVATPDCRLIALDAASGKQIWSQQSCDPEQGYTVTAAPYLGKDQVFIGNAGSESGYRNRGYVTAYDADSGRQLWRFYTVPSGGPEDAQSTAMALAAKTWTGEVWTTYGGGGSVWDSMTYDPETRLLYFGTAGALPYVHRDRSPQGGDNLFTESVLALNAETGRYVWHYQTVPGDSWEFNATMNIILAEIEIDGRERRVAMIAPKNGFFYVLDRTTGKLISADNFATVNWATHIDLATGRPVVNPQARYWEQPGERRLIWPNSWGAHSWNPMAFHPGLELAYIPVIDLPDSVAYRGPDEDDSEIVIPQRPDGQPHVPGRLVAWDPRIQQQRWAVDRALPFNGGVLATGGNLVFQGTASGTFEAFSADRGELLWALRLGSAVSAAPVTYRLDGEQYVLIGTGAGGGLRAVYPDFSAAEDARAAGRLFALKLEGKADLPIRAPVRPPLPEPPPLEASAERIAQGDALYRENCSGCHGKRAKAMPGSSIPDLRYLSAERHQQWQAIVLDGALRGKGMLPFELRAEESEAIRAYVLSKADEAYAEQMNDRGSE